MKYSLIKKKNIHKNINEAKKATIAVTKILTKQIEKRISKFCSKKNKKNDDDFINTRQESHSTSQLILWYLSFKVFILIVIDNN